MIQIYTYRLNHPLTDSLRTGLLRTLNSEERSLLPNPQSKKFDVSLMSKVLLKKLLIKYFGFSAENLVMGKSALGKPQVKKPSGTLIDMSISHSKGYIAIGISKDCRVGVDIEVVRDFDLLSTLDFFSKAEADTIVNAGSKQQQLITFFKIWTAKESYLKMIGQGFFGKIPNLKFGSKENDIHITAALNSETKEFVRVFEIDKSILSVCADSKRHLDNLTINYIDGEGNITGCLSNDAVTSANVTGER